MLLLLFCCSLAASAASISNGCRGLFGGGGGVDRVCDPDALLSPGALASLQRAARLVEGGAPHECGGALVPGFEFAVILSKSGMPALPGRPPRAHIGAAARDAHDALGVGRAACNDGLVLALSRDARELHLSTGAGAARYLRDAAVGAVAARMRPALRAGDLAGALEGAAADVLAALQAAAAAAGEAPLPAGHDGARAAEVAAHAAAIAWEDFWALAWVAAVVAAAAGAAAWAWCAWRRKREAEAREQARIAALLQRMQAARDAPPAPAGGGGGGGGGGGPPLAARMTTCPICLDDFEPESVLTTLPCQHRFHAGCVANWAAAGASANNRQCPVCRAPIDGAPRAPPPPPPAPHAGGGGGAGNGSGGGGGGGGSGGGLFGFGGGAGAAPAAPRARHDDAVDLLFLLNRMAHRFPGHAAEFRGYGAEPLRTDFVRAHTAAQLAAAEAARAAAAAAARAMPGAFAAGSRGFGGGSSRGGGGRGGSW